MSEETGTFRGTIKPLVIPIVLSNLDAVKREIHELEIRIGVLDGDLNNIIAKLNEAKSKWPAS